MALVFKTPNKVRVIINGVEVKVSAIPAGRAGMKYRFEAPPEVKIERMDHDDACDRPRQSVG